MINNNTINNFICIDISDNEKKFIITFEYNYKTVEIIKKIGSSKWISNNKTWEITNNNNFKILDIVNLFIKNQYTVNFTQSVQKIYDKAIKQNEKRAIDIEKINKIKNLEDYDLDVSKFINVDLFNFQKVSYKFIEETNCNCILSLSMGLGKSLISLTYSLSKNYKSLIIAPATLRLNWKDEIEKFSKGATLEIIRSGDEINLRDIKDFTIINYDLLGLRSVKSQKTIESILKCVEKNKFNMVICDESQKMKNEKTKWTKFIHKNFKNIEHKLLLSATPIKSRPIEYFSQLKFIDKKKWNSKIDYAQKFCGAHFNGFGMDYNGASNLEELYFETSPYIIRKEKKDVLKDLPDKLYTKIPIELTHDETKIYKNLEGKISNELKENESNSLAVSLAILQKLKQYTSDLKIKSAIEIIDSVIESGEKIVVFSGYNEPLKKLHEHYKDNSVMFIGSMSEKLKDEQKKLFVNNDKYKIFLGGTLSAGTGLNLQVSSTVIFLDQPWTPADFEQAADRAYRIGTVKNVNIITLVCEETIDEYIYEMLENKSKIISKILDNKEHNIQVETSIVKDIIKIYKK